VAIRELGVRCLRAAIGALNRPEQLRLEPVRVDLVELLVRGASATSATAIESIAPANVSSRSCRASASV
jgi:hypothetical protein